MTAGNFRAEGGGGHLVLTRGRPTAFAVLPLLIVALIGVAFVSAAIGAAPASIGRAVVSIFASGADAAHASRDELILVSIRLPRVVMAAMVGALLATAGTLMQGLFRNPLADPGLVGVSAGAGLAAAAMIVVADKALPAAVTSLTFLLPVAAFLGALATTSLLYRIATRRGRTAIATMLLAGLALGALAGAGTGFLVFLADDRQLRDITFWLLGSLAGATWTKTAAVAPFLALLLISLGIVGRGLDALVLGEAEAFHMGVAVERLKRFLIALIAVAAGAAVSVCGVVGFIGIMVPHTLRLVIGPGHRLLLPASACGGAILLVAADTFARTVAAPAELPIGIVTAAIGAPFFLFLLLRQRTLLV